MMLERVELLAVSAALVSIVRRSIKYSENIEKLYRDKRESDMYKNRSIQRRRLVESTAYSPDQRGQYALVDGVGFCDELSLAILYLSPFLPINLSEQYYITFMVIPKKHAFVLIHQSNRIHTSVSNKRPIKLCPNFAELSQIGELNNAIIVDPWIYKSTPVKEYEAHLCHADLFEVRSYYQGDIYINGCSNMIDVRRTIHQAPFDLRSLVQKFDDLYQEERKKLDLNPSGSGRRYSDVRRSFDANMLKQQQKMISLKNFLIKLQDKSSTWYSSLPHSNRKGKLFSEMINDLNLRITTNRDLSNDLLRSYFFIAIRISPFVRGKNPPKDISFANIDMTKTAKSLLSINIVPEVKYAFEEIEDMSLDDIRQIRATPSDQRQQYKLLLKYVYRHWYGANELKVLNIIYSKKEQAAIYAEVSSGIYF